MGFSKHIIKCVLQSRFTPNAYCVELILAADQSKQTEDEQSSMIHPKYHQPNGDTVPLWLCPFYYLRRHNMQKVFNFYADPSHGWMAVKQLTPSSYQRGDTASGEALHDFTPIGSLQ
jgi:hypothetical protein